MSDGRRYDDLTFVERKYKSKGELSVKWGTIGETLMMKRDR